MTKHKFTGVIPILATPFNDDESLDLASWQRMIEFMVGLGVDGITILGVLGESNRLNDHEREALIKSAVATVNKRMPVIVGTSHSGSAAAAYLSRMACATATKTVPTAGRTTSLFHSLMITSSINNQQSAI